MCLLGTALLFSCNKNQNTFPAGDEISADVLSADEVVDLGLSVKWLNHNLGADSQLSAGHCYAWGSIEPHLISQELTSDQYKQEMMRHFKPQGADFTKFGADGDTLRFYVAGGDHAGENLPEQFDAATIANAAWALPSQKEFEELLDNTTQKWGHIGSTRGWLLTSRVKGYESASIFLPVHGSWYQMKDDPWLSRASYWASTGTSPDDCQTMLGSTAQLAVCISLNETDVMLKEYLRYRAMMIRPVVR